MPNGNIGASVARIVREQIERLQQIRSGPGSFNAGDVEGVEQELANAAALAESDLGRRDGAGGMAGIVDRTGAPGDAGASSTPATPVPSDRSGQLAASAGVGNAGGTRDDRLADLEDRIDRLETFVGLDDPNRRAAATLQTNASAGAPAGEAPTPSDDSGRLAASAGIGVGPGGR